MLPGREPPQNQTKPSLPILRYKTDSSRSMVSTVPTRGALSCSYLRVDAAGGAPPVDNGRKHPLAGILLIRGRYLLFALGITEGEWIMAGLVKRVWGGVRLQLLVRVLHPSNI